MEVRQNWFGGIAPTNWKPTRTTIGAGADGVITINIDIPNESEANGHTIKVVAGVGDSKALSAKLTGKDIEVTLGTDGAGALDATKNTAKLIAAKISTLTNITATYSGTGATAIAAAIAKKNFTDMQLGTECPEPFVVVKVWDQGNSEWDYYTTIAPNGKHDSNWRVFNLTQY